jgi:hypothetical protein
MEYINVNKASPIKRYKQVIDNAIYGDKRICYCQPEIFKNASANQNSAYNSQNMRISTIVRNFKGGQLQFGNTYLGTNIGLELNYLGRLEGMPGGSGSPPVNKF